MEIFEFFWISVFTTLKCRGVLSSVWTSCQNFWLKKFVLCHIFLVVLHLKQIFASWFLCGIVNLYLGLIIWTWLSRAYVGVKKVLHACLLDWLEPNPIQVMLRWILVAGKRTILMILCALHSFTNAVEHWPLARLGDLGIPWPRR
jgi:hypothetical protein